MKEIKGKCKYKFLREWKYMHSNLAASTLALR